MGKKKKKVASVSAPLTKDSDEMKEMHCEECEKHNDGYATAVSFCVDCVEYKCITCQKYHMRQLKTHKILENASMPQDFYFEKCPIHPMKLIKFYCCVCNKVTCQECKDYEHLTCCNVNHLPTLASNIQKSDEYKNLQQNLNNLSADIQVTEKLIKAKSEMIEEQEDKAIKTLKEYGEKAKEAFKKQHQEIVDKFDKEMEETIARLNKERKELFEELSEKEKTFEKNLQKADSEMKDHIVSTNTNFKLLKSEHTNLVTKLRDLINDLELAQKLDENCKLFIKMKSAKQLYTYLRLTIKALQKAEIHRYNLKTPDIQSLGDKIVFSFEKGHPLNVDRRVVFNFDINDSYGDTTQLLVLSEKILLVLSMFCYHNNDNLKVLNILETSKGECINEVKFDKKPSGITKIADNKIAITFPCEEIIRVITFSEEMKVLNTTDIPANGCCTSIAYCKSHFVVVYSGTGRVKVLSMSGKIVKSFDKDAYGNVLFENPTDIIVSPDNTLIYVSEYFRETVTCIKLGGNAKTIYKYDKLTSPSQLDVDEYGSVYVCGVATNKIYQFSPDLTTMKILIHANSMTAISLGIAYCQNSKRFFVALNDKIAVYSIF